MSGAILENLTKNVIEGNDEAIKKLAKEAIDAGIDPNKAIKEGLMKGMEVISRKYRDEEIYLPDMMIAADAFTAGLKILKIYMKKENIATSESGIIVIGTALGDVHDIGKSLVGVSLSAAGWNVIDLGIDVPPLRFIEKAMESNADVIGVSSLLTSSASYQKDVIEELKARNLRKKIHVIVGGGSTTSEWAKQIGADGWGDEMDDAVLICREIMGEKNETHRPAGETTRCHSYRYNINEG